MHWFNPPYVMKLIEIIPGLETSEEVVGNAIDFCKKLGKVPIRVKECAGFLVNRHLGIYINEAFFLLEEGEKPAVIDQGALQAGMPMGPLTLGDMVGWDIIYHSNQTLFEEFGARFTTPKVLSQMVAEGRLGQKAGRGIYATGSEKPEVSEAVSDPEKVRVLSNRLLFVMMNEGIRCLEEGVASREDIDRALQLGAGMPKGPLARADEVGLDVLFQELDELKNRYGERFRPSPLLRRKVKAGHLGKKSGKGLSI
jgi:3-hydroxyacyl-CoA dehydrogenase